MLQLLLSNILSYKLTNLFNLVIIVCYIFLTVCPKKYSLDFLLSTSSRAFSLSCMVLLSFFPKSSCMQMFFIVCSQYRVRNGSVYCSEMADLCTMQSFITLILSVTCFVCGLSYIPGINSYPFILLSQS